LTFVQLRIAQKNGSHIFLGRKPRAWRLLT